MACSASGAALAVLAPSSLSLFSLKDIVVEKTMIKMTLTVKLFPSTNKTSLNQTSLKNICQNCLLFSFVPFSSHVIFIYPKNTYHFHFELRILPNFRINGLLNQCKPVFQDFGGTPYNLKATVPSPP